MMHFFLFQISPFFRKFFDIPWRIFPILAFSEIIFDFHPPKFLMTFYYKFSIPPIFPVSLHFPPISQKLLFPYFKKCSLCFRKMYVFLHTLYVFRIPPILTLMHLCIIQCTYWTPLPSIVGGIGNESWMLF